MPKTSKSNIFYCALLQKWNFIFLHMLQSFMLVDWVLTIYPNSPLLVHFNLIELTVGQSIINRTINLYVIRTEGSKQVGRQQTFRWRVVPATSWNELLTSITVKYWQREVTQILTPRRKAVFLAQKISYTLVKCLRFRALLTN